MVPTKSKPGPRRTSCLTCRKRRKKCDLARPFCERCLKGGHECLGYEHSESHEGTQEEDPNIPVSQSHPIPTTVLVSAIGSEPIHPTTWGREPGLSPSSLPSGSCQDIDRNCASYDPTWGPFIFRSALTYSLARLTPCDNNNYTVVLTPEDNNFTWPQYPIASPRIDLTSQPLNARKPFHTVADTQSAKDHLFTIIQAFCASIPPFVDATQIMREGHIVQIIHEYRSHRANYWFTPPPSSIRGLLIQGPKTMIWVMYLGAKIFQALSEDPHGTMIRRCVGWINELEQNLGKFCPKSSLNGAADWLLTQLEFAFLQFTTVGCSSGYPVLQKALPGFLLLVAADSNLHVEHPGGNLVISFPHTFGAPQYQLKWFVMYDAITSLLLGVLPLVEYGYTSECESASHGLEWIHGIPVALAETISQVNSWRAGSRVAPLDDWRNLERRVLAWHSSLTVAEGQESGANITARLAIQEGWRHVTLIYIYMGMCGVSSHDPRVQASISRIIQLGEAVNNLPIGVHIFVHCVVAGLAARYERHRSIVHEKLLSFKGTRVWLFHGSEFGRILEHLWYGVGAGGAPVTWDDYVRSRCAVLPI